MPFFCDKMEYSLIITTLLLSLTLTQSLADVSSLQDHQTQDHLDPLQDQDQDLSTNNQDKRTLCSAFNKCGGQPTYVKRLVIRGGLKHQIVGYTPVVRPVAVRPVVLGGYRYSKPKLHFRLKAPSTVHGGWKPVPTKPVVEVVKPENHVDVIHNNPVPHVDHVAPTYVHQQHVPAPVPVDHVHARPDNIHYQTVQPAFVNVRPVAVPAPHVDQVHQISVPHGNHYDTFSHIDHLQPAGAVPIARPVVPVAPPPTLVKPFVPSPVLFEVTKPNLGVLPLGARFPSPILREVPHVHLAPSFPVSQAVPVASPALVHGHPIPHHHHGVQGIIQTPVGLPAIAPQPGVSVEYHGTRNYLPFSGAAGFVHQIPVGAVHPHQAFNFADVHPHQHLHFGHNPQAFTPQQALPFEHHSHAFASSQQQLPHDHPTNFQLQSLPHEHSTQFLAPQQQLPHEHPTNFQLQSLPHEHSTQFLASQQQLPHEHTTNFQLQSLPHEHSTQFLASQQQLPHEHATNFQLQSLPHDHSGQSLVSQQQLQLPHENNLHFQQQLQSFQQYQDIPQGQLPLEGEQQQQQQLQQNFNHFLQNNQDAFSSNGLNVQNFDQSNVIQPGQTDVQIPYHLPQHGGWEGNQGGGSQEESRGFGDQVFRPSPQLEAPYQK